MRKHLSLFLTASSLFLAQGVMASSTDQGDEIPMSQSGGSLQTSTNSTARVLTHNITGLEGRHIPVNTQTSGATSVENWEYHQPTVEEVEDARQRVNDFVQQNGLSATILTAEYTAGWRPVPAATRPNENTSSVPRASAHAATPVNSLNQSQGYSFQPAPMDQD